MPNGEGDGMSEYKQLTVAELITKLQTQNPNALVEVEGCDCTGSAGGLYVYKSGVIIVRTDSRYYAEEMI